ncbi:MAG: SpoIIE family protein phosphatase, partial [Bacteroidales bacterium]|nr:SpoIIE family protein phosphatase [Bacteroidales bacterium]
LLNYNISTENEYSYLLNGDKNIWSEWTKETYKEFSNLHEGEYIFKVKARNIFKFESEITQIKFTVLPPWYRTSFAYFIYLFLLLFIVWLSIKIYSIKLKRENENLEKLVTQRTAEINLQKEEIKTQSENLKKINTQLFERNHEINQQNEEIKAIAESLKQANTIITQKNKYITGSINYAQKIQTAILPDKDFIKKLLPQHFILYMPKDIISGDFYWLKQINNSLLIVAADSTGHGVPGGFISMLGVSVLNEVVRKSEIINPAMALNDLRYNVKKSLKHGKKNSKDDGFDMAFVEINTENNELIFAGANMPLYIVRNKQLIEIKPVMNPIGIHPQEKSFINNKFKLLNNDMIYLSSDGYKDQLNSNNEQFKVDKFKKLIVDISSTSMNNQIQTLKEEIIEWKGLKNQTDDILIFGFRWLM